MRAAIVIAPKEFKDETLARALGMFRRWGVDAVVVGFVNRECVGSHGAAVMPDMNLSTVRAEDFDVLFIADGEGVESYKIYEVTPLVDLVRAFAAENKIVAGVGSGVKVIAKANIIAGRKIAVPRNHGIEGFVKLYKGVVSQEEMECATNVMSLRDYTKTEEFVAAILDRLGVR